MPIKVRLTIWYVAFLGLILVVLGSLLYGLFYYSFHNEVTLALTERTAHYANSVSLVLDVQGARPEGDSAGTLEAPMIDMYSGTDIYMELRLLDGRVVARSDTLGEQQALPWLPDAVTRAREGQSTVTDISYVSHGVPLRLLTYPIFLHGQPVAVVQSAQSLAPVDRRLGQIALGILVAISSTLLLALLVGVWMVQRALAPVHSITQAALHISRAEDLSRRLENVQPMDEIGRLTNAFNEMLGRLDDVFRDQQRFVADVSHELRTPLTALCSTIDLLKRGVIQDPEEQKEVIEILESEVARLQRLVSDLLLLARADAGQELLRSPVELDTVLLEVFREARLLAESSGKAVRVRLGHEDRATVLGDADRLKQLLLNLVDNAIKYTPQGEVVLSLYVDEGHQWVQVVVQDTGIGIPAEAMPQLFRRFYRVDKARSRDVGGSGLGLAIAQWIVEAHGGQIEVESAEGVGSRFTVSLPTQQASAPNQLHPIPSSAALVPS